MPLQAWQDKDESTVPLRKVEANYNNNSKRISLPLLLVLLLLPRMLQWLVLVAHPPQAKLLKKVEDKVVVMIMKSNLIYEHW